jgi:integrase
MASIREVPRKDGTTTYQVLYRIDGRQSSLPCADKKSADALVELIAKVGVQRALEIEGISAHRTRRAPSSLTVETWLDRYIDHLTGVEQYTIDKYRAYVRNDIAPVLGQLPLTALTEEDISLWVQGMESSTTKRGRPPTPKTIANKHGFLSGALAAAVPRHIGANPAAGRRLPRGDGDDEEIRMLTRKEFKVLRRSLQPHWHPLLDFLVSSGARWGEATALKPADVDRKSGTVKIRRAWKHSPTNGYEIGPTKTKRSNRKINVPSTVLDQLDYGGEWLFTNTVGGPVRYYTFKANVWNPSVAKTKLDPRPTPHALRHTCASWMLAAGVPIAVVSRHLGHENIATTVDIYGSVDRSSFRAAADVMEKLLS